MAYAIEFNIRVVLGKFVAGIMPARLQYPKHKSLIIRRRASTGLAVRATMSPTVH